MANVFIIYSKENDEFFDFESAYTSREEMLSELENLKKNFPTFEFKFRVLVLKGVVNSSTDYNCYSFNKTDNK